MSPQEIIDSSEEELLTFLAKKSRNRIADISKTSDLLKKAARDSYRLDKCMYEQLNVSLASSFNCIQTYQKEIKLIDQAIEKCINGMNPNAFIILKSIPGIGPVWAASILSEIGDITAFHSSDALAKYAGLSKARIGSSWIVNPYFSICMFFSLSIVILLAYIILPQRINEISAHSKRNFSVKQKRRPPGHSL